MHLLTHFGLKARSVFRAVVTFSVASARGSKTAMAPTSVPKANKADAKSGCRYAIKDQLLAVEGQQPSIF